MKCIHLPGIFLALLLVAAATGCSSSSSTPGCQTCAASSIVFASAPALLAAYSVHPGGGLGTPAEVAGAAASFALAPSPTASFLYQPDVLSHSILAYSIDSATATTTPVNGSPFSMGSNSQGAYGIAITPGSQYLYASDVNGSIVAFGINASTGALTQLGGSPLATGGFPRALTIDPAGRFLYASDPYGNVLGYAIRSQDGSLTPVPGSPFALLTGSVPGMLAVEPFGNFLYVALTGLGKISVLAIDSHTGALNEIPASPFGAGKKVQALVIAPNHYLYAVNASDNTISGYSMNPGDGSLSSLSGSPYSTNVQPSLAYTSAFPGSLATDRLGSVLWVGAPWAPAIATFGIDGNSGILTFQSATNLPVSTPPGQVSVAFYQP